MRFYPISSYSFDDKYKANILLFSYNENQEKVVIRIDYPYWFYVECTPDNKRSIDNLLVNETGIFVGSVFEERRSTRDCHQTFYVIRIFARTEKTKRAAVSKLSGFKVHEQDSILTPLLKLLGEKRLYKYSWMEIETTLPAYSLTNYSEFIGDVSTLCQCKEELIPPTFSIFSFDGEMNSPDWNKMPDAKMGPSAAIHILCITFRDKERYEEHAIVFGVDISPIYLKHKPEELNSGLVTIHTVKTESELLDCFFQLIKDLDPDIICGHNILGFDIPYLLKRYIWLKESNTLPNISRLQNHYVSYKPVKWNNSQVSVTGTSICTPGRIWIDTLIVCARGLFGKLPNNKLDTLGKDILGMRKNDMDYREMFKGFDLLNRKSENCIDQLYESYLEAYNRKIPKELPSPSVDDINDLIEVLNGIDQRGEKIKIMSAKDFLSPSVLKERYREYRKKMEIAIEKWNISNLPSSSPTEKIATIWYLITLYCLQDTRIPYQAIEQQAIISVLREQANTFSVDIEDVLLRGQVYTTTCSQYRYCYQYGFMMDFGLPGGPTGKYEYEGGYVGKGEPGLKIKDDDSLVFVLDFASLYPTIIIAYNICYTTWVPPDHLNSLWEIYCPILEEKEKELRDKGYDESELESYLTYLRSQQGKDILSWDQYPGEENLDIQFLAQCILAREAPLKDKVNYICNRFEVPNPHSGKTHVHWYCRPFVLQGIIPKMLWEQYLTRKSIKKKMSAAFKSGNIAMGITLNAQQLGTKISMNATYGAFGTEYNRLANYPGAEVITFIGRSSIHRCNEMIEERGYGTIVYNDTDSAMILRDSISEKFNRNIDAIAEYGNKVAEECSKLFPKPMSLECENFFISFLLKGPKMYAAIKWDGKSIDSSTYTRKYVEAKNLLYIKGLAPVRRDKYFFQRQLYTSVLFDIMRRTDISLITRKFEKALQTIWKCRTAVSKENKRLIEKQFSYNMGITPTALSSTNSTMNKWCTNYSQKYGRKPVAGERFQLLVSDIGDGKTSKSGDKLVTIDWLLEEKRSLDVKHYILALSTSGSVVGLLNLAYPEYVPIDCIQKYYLPQLSSL